MTNKELLATIEKLTAENESLKKQGVKRLSMKVSDKGGVSVYGLGRFPVTLYQTQWIRLLDISDELREFLKLNADKLTTKDGAVNTKATKEAKALREMDAEDNAALFKGMTAEEAKELAVLLRQAQAE